MSNPRLTITELTITSSTTDHRAERDTVKAGWWSVTWLPGRQLTQCQAITAMTIAEFIAHGVRPEHRAWAHVIDFAAELDLTAETALRLIGEPIPNQHSADRLTMTQIAHCLAATLAELANAWETAEYSAMGAGVPLDTLSDGYPFGELDLSDVTEATRRWADRLAVPK